MKKKTALVILLVLLEFRLFGQENFRNAEILWDNWGIPHIYAENNESLFYAYGWAQTQNHGNLVLQLYGQARGKAAEYWGEKYIDSDTWVVRNSIMERAGEWYLLQDGDWKNYLDAFASGINDYAVKHPELIGEEFRQVLPINAIDILAHCHRVTHFVFLASSARVKSALEIPGDQIGSNAWAIGPSKSASGNTMLLTNPHLPWRDLYTYFEAHLNGPGTNAYGISRIGFPVLTMAFNKDAGYAQTVNTNDGQDLYRLTLLEGGYLWNGKKVDFKARVHQLKIKQQDGSFLEEEITVKESVHGPVVEEGDGGTYALRVAGLDQAFMLRQYWGMCRARSHKEFILAIRELQIPMYTFMFADRQGNIFTLFNGRVPKKPVGNWKYWSGAVPGEGSATLWTDYHNLEELPSVLNPASGWLQNTNEPPWTATWPMPNGYSDFPEYLSPPPKMSFRTISSIGMLMENEKISFEKLIELKHSTRLVLADHILADLMVAAKNSEVEILVEAAEVLENWDRLTEEDSKGAVLFDSFVRKWVGGDANLSLLDNNSELFAVPWTETDPIHSPRGIADLEDALIFLQRAAFEIFNKYRALDISWGEVFRFQLGGLDLPGNGGPGPMGAFRTMTLGAAENNLFIPAQGDSYFAAVEFSDPIKVMALMAYGNASQPGSKYRELQLPLLRNKEMRPVFMDRFQLEGNIEEVTNFGLR